MPGRPTATRGTTTTITTRRRDDEDDYDDASGRGSDHDDYQLNELIDDEITLGWWTSPDGTGGEPVSLHVPDSEVCATTPSADLTPYQSEYEGYMGNYGNTLDRWYRRAAVVVWARDRAFAARAEAGSQWALSELDTRIEAGDLGGARAAAESLAPFWNKIGSRAGLLGTALHVAAGLGAAGTAAMLLEPFRVETVAPEHAGGLARRPGSTARSGRAGSSAGGSGRSSYLEAGPIRVGREAAGAVRGAACRRGPEVARLLAAGAWGWMGDQLRLWTTTARAEIREPQLEMLSSPLVRLLEAADDELRDEIVAALRGYGDNVLGCLMPALRSAAGCRRPRGRRRASMWSRGTAGSGSARSSRGRCATKTTGRSGGPGAGATCVTRWGRFSVPGRGGSSSGRWRRTGGGTCTPGSTRPPAGAAPDPAAGAAIHARADEDRVSCSRARRTRGARP